jgi:hypothetical protein
MVEAYEWLLVGGAGPTSTPATHMGSIVDGESVIQLLRTDPDAAALYFLK